MNSKPSAVFDRARHIHALFSPVAMCWSAYAMFQCYGHPITQSMEEYANMDFTLPLPDADIVVNAPLLALAIERFIFSSLLVESGGSAQEAQRAAWYGIENEPAEALTMVRNMLQDMTAGDWQELSGTYQAKH